MIEIFTPAKYYCKQHQNQQVKRQWKAKLCVQAILEMVKLEVGEPIEGVYIAQLNKAVILACVLRSKSWRSFRFNIN